MFWRSIEIAPLLVFLANSGIAVSAGVKGGQPDRPFEDEGLDRFS